MSVKSKQRFRVKKPKFIDRNPDSDVAVTRPVVDEREVEELVKNLDGRIRKVVQKQRKKARQKKQKVKKLKGGDPDKKVTEKKKGSFKKQSNLRSRKVKSKKRSTLKRNLATFPKSENSKSEVKKTKPEKQEIPDLRHYQSARMFKEYLYRTHCKIPTFLKDVKVNRVYIDKTKKSGPTGNFSIPSVLLKTTYPKERLHQKKLKMTLDSQSQQARRSELDVKKWKKR